MSIKKPAEQQEVAERLQKKFGVDLLPDVKVLARYTKMQLVELLLWERQVAHHKAEARFKGTQEKISLEQKSIWQRLMDFIAS